MAALQLYRQQEEGIARWSHRLPGRHQQQPRRLVLGWATGCGKTAGALSLLERRYMPTAAKVLVICPAVVRRHWLRELTRWAPSWMGAGAAIELGRLRKVPGPAAKRRDAAYRARLQVVSYDLLKDVDATNWTLIILDELHHIAAPTSRQSKRVAALLKANPNVDVLGLTATPIPTEVSQIWNPMRLLFGEHIWGAPARTGAISWDFARRYCLLEKNEYGTAIRGSNPDTRAELKARLQDCCHFLTRADIRSDLPPLDVQLLELEEEDIVASAIAWVRDKLAEGVRRVVVLVHFRQSARAIFNVFVAMGTSAGATFRYVDGEQPAGDRDALLQEVEAVDGPSVLIGTHGALAEGVRLMWAEEVLIGQWPMSPGRMVQLLGRFQSVGSGALSPHVSLAAHTERWGASQTLLERVQAMLEITGPSPSAEKLQQIISDNKLAGDDLASLFNDMLSDVRPGSWDDNQGDYRE